MPCSECLFIITIVLHAPKRMNPIHFGHYLMFPSISPAGEAIDMAHTMFISSQVKTFSDRIHAPQRIWSGYWHFLKLLTISWHNCATTSQFTIKCVLNNGSPGEWTLMFGVTFECILLCQCYIKFCTCIQYPKYNGQLQCNIPKRMHRCHFNDSLAPRQFSNSLVHCVYQYNY